MTIKTKKILFGKELWQNSYQNFYNLILKVLNKQFRSPLNNKRWIWKDLRSILLDSVKFSPKQRHSNVKRVFFSLLVFRSKIMGNKCPILTKSAVYIKKLNLLHILKIVLVRIFDELWHYTARRNTSIIRGSFNKFPDFFLFGYFYS